MKKKLQDKLFDKYPKIFRQKDLSMQQTSMCWGIDCGNGWFNIIDTLCTLIKHHILRYEGNYEGLLKKYNELSENEKPDMKRPVNSISLEATQVKEKYGGLRFYVDGGDQYTEGLIDMAEAMSEHICDICGAEGKNSCGDTHWYATRCSKHRITKQSFKKPDKPGSISLDFDGVINSYKSGFVAIDKLPDVPVDGALEFIRETIDYGFKVYIFSTRNKYEAGKKAIYKWLKDNGLEDRYLNTLELPSAKPIAKVYIDDRAWSFLGKFPSLEEINSFVPWHGGNSSSQK